MDHTRCLSELTLEGRRVLKVIEVGDFYRKHTRPQIRLEGRWLEKAGIHPNAHVQVENPQPGMLLIRVLENT